MTQFYVENFVWIVPLGALALGIGGIAYAHIITRRLERKLAREAAKPAE